MSDVVRQITLGEWDERYERLRAAGMKEAGYGGPLGRHVVGGNTRLRRLRYDSSAAALRLWNFLLTEERRLFEARRAGKTIVGAMKDLGTVPVMAYALPDVVAFYPDGAWWLPCVMEHGAGLLARADALGVDESFCPVRAMLGAFLSEGHFPEPALLICSAGAVCDDFSAIAQRLEGLGRSILWWEVPARRAPEPGEPAVALPAGFEAPEAQAAFVRGQLERVREAIERAAGARLTDDLLVEGIRRANEVRGLLRDLRRVVFTAEPCPLGALEMLIAEMLAIHFCSDLPESRVVLSGLRDEARRRAADGVGVLAAGAVRVFWVNPVADLWAMNVLEECGGRVCGTELLFCHAIEDVPEDLPPIDALARAALADPMVGPAGDRAERICREIDAFGAEAVVVCRIPGASHCALEGKAIGGMIGERLSLPVLEVEVPPLSDGVAAGLRTRLGALIELARERRV